LCKKELEKSSATKGFVRQQALKEKGEKKRVRLFFLLLCCRGQQWLPPSPSTPYVSPGIGPLRGMSAKALGTCPLLAQMSAAGVTLSPRPWLCWELVLGAAAWPETHRCEALGFLLRVSPGDLR